MKSENTLTLSCDAMVTGPPRSSLWRNVEVPFFFNNCNENQKEKRKVSKFSLLNSIQKKKVNLPIHENSLTGRYKFLKDYKNQYQIISVMVS